MNNSISEMRGGDLIPLKGIMVGNGATDFHYDCWPSYPDTVYGFRTIPKDVYDAAAVCFRSFREVLPQDDTPECQAAWDKVMALTGDLNWYDLFRKPSPGGPGLQSDRYGSSMVEGELKEYRRGYTIDEYTPWLKPVLSNVQKKHILGGALTDYLNREDVRTALHIPADHPAWEPCSAYLQYHPQPEGSIWIYTVLRHKIRMLFFSGNTDGAIPTYGSRQWIEELGWNVTDEWRTWLTEGDDIVSGWVENRDGLDFIAVHGVGHMAPQWKRGPVTNMVNAWLHKVPFPPNDPPKDEDTDN